MTLEFGELSGYRSQIINIAFKNTCTATKMGSRPQAGLIPWNIDPIMLVEINKPVEKIVSGQATGLKMVVSGS